MRLANKVVVVTGGAQGIGQAIVAKCWREGAQVVSLDRDQARNERSVAELGAGDQVPLALECDVTVEGEVAGAMGTTVERFGTIDALVNNAGINAYFDATRMTEAEWDAVFAVDLKGAWLCAKYALPAMRQAGGGSIVNIASIHAQMTMQGMFPYAAAKSGLVGMTRSLALDFGAEGVRVNALCPGWIRTQLVQEWFERQTDPAASEAQVLSVQPLGRIGTPEEVANFVAFLASDEASFVHGAMLLVDGGLSARFAS